MSELYDIRENYSATVRLRFESNGCEWELAATGLNEFVTREPMELEPGTVGEVVIVIDGHQQRRLVVLPDGASGTGTVRTEDVT